MTDQTIPDGPPVCPECHGTYVRGINFDHDPACDLGNADQGTRYNDMTRMDADGAAYYTRCIRPHELALANATTLPVALSGGPAGINWTVTVHRYGLNANTPGGTQYGAPVGGQWVRVLNPRN